METLHSARLLTLGQHKLPLLHWRSAKGAYKSFFWVELLVLKYAYYRGALSASSEMLRFNQKLKAARPLL